MIQVPIKGRLECGEDPLIPGGDRRDRGIMERKDPKVATREEDPMKEPPKAGISTCIYYADKYSGLSIKDSCIYQRSCCSS
jgi:hypothetical protein